MRTATSQGTATHAARTTKTHLREARFDDYPQIARLQSRNGLQPRLQEDWLALWRGNPAYEATRGTFPIGWVLETADGEIVGNIGNVPLSYSYEGLELRAATACGWAVDEMYRGYSMLMLDRLLRQRDIDLLVLTTVSSTVEPAFRTFRLKRVPVGTWNNSHVWITGCRGFVESYLHSKSVPGAPLLGYFGGAVLAATEFFRRDRPETSCASEYRVEWSTDFAPEFDAFWRDLRAQNSGVLLAVRSREALRWHFCRQLRTSGAFLVTAWDGSSLVAYAVFDRQDKPEIGLKRMRLVDCQALNGHEEAIRRLMHCMLQRCRKEKVHLLEVVGCWLASEHHPSQPHTRKLKSWMAYYKPLNPGFSARTENTVAWSPSCYDGDASL